MPSSLPIPETQTFKIDTQPIAWVLAVVFLIATAVESVSGTTAPKVVDCAIASFCSVGIALIARNGHQALAANVLAVFVAFAVNWLMWWSLLGSYNIIAWASPLVVMFTVLACKRSLAIAMTIGQIASFGGLMWVDAQPGATAYELYPFFQYDRLVYATLILGVTHLVCDILIRHFETARAREATLIGELVELNRSLEKRVEERTQELAQLNRGLTQANQELEAFSYSVAHDLRSPLNAVTGFTEIVLEREAEPLSSKARDYLGKVLLSSRNMATLIDSLLELSRLSFVPIQPHSLDLLVMAGEIVTSLRNRGDYPNTKLRVQPMPKVDADPTLLRALLVNLIGNAFKYSARAESPEVSIGSVEGTTPVVFFVADNGAGFDMSQANRLFKPFQRLHRAAEFPGTGVGLASVRRIVERHGGRIWVEAAPDLGAKFFFTLAPEIAPSVQTGEAPNSEG